ncbi:hypothetical protein P5673_006517 [Acropora cervicornis]|uniref:Uncharacterized protein n=1 Tax=Acropora cervicornis TaxID=6130 RepID=A0AAD9QWG2_ACRCE|nr:hypothetical protein P5673_006517 [Acropora cervicornis]
MPTQDVFPKSVVLHFPPSVYQKTGASEMLPKLLQILQPDNLRCVQFLRGGRVRVSYREKAVRDHCLSGGMRFEDQDIPVTRDAEKVTVRYLRDLPYEVACDDVIDFLSTYGEVLTVERSVAADFPNLCNGNRIVKMNWLNAFASIEICSNYGEGSCQTTATTAELPHVMEL